LDKLAETPRKQVEDGSESDSDDEDIPFACLICRKPYTDPVATRCGHYYCSACAIKRYAKTPKCLACGAPTGGIFNRADKIIDKLNKKRAEKEDHEQEDAQPGVEIEGLGSGSDSGGD
jgi:RING finger protein 113A